MMDRRRFMTQSAGAAAALLLPIPVVAATSRGPRHSRQIFESVIGQSFRGVDEKNLASNFVLLEVAPLAKKPGQERFRLVFEKPYLNVQAGAGGLFRMHHPDMGPMLMRLDPSVKDASTYIAEFNLIT